MEQMRRSVETAEQQRQIQQQLAFQRQMLQEQRQQEALQQGLNALGQMGQQMQNSNQQMQQYFMSRPVPQVESLAPPRGNRISCLNVGQVTRCQ
ncbi:hypothetical protein DDK22_07290 [Cupriavidus necator]|uniref:Uncharacterized protein n=1 Tax=Cupriavidus necator TaxID=106590 RepID=A0A367PPT4_CUPNE|nr:hypothetical protein DDK22_07290 [Cupriavidus necator]